MIRCIFENFLEVSKEEKDPNINLVNWLMTPFKEAKRYVSFNVSRLKYIEIPKFLAHMISLPVKAQHLKNLGNV